MLLLLLLLHHLIRRLLLKFAAVSLRYWQAAMMLKACLRQHLLLITTTTFVGVFIKAGITWNYIVALRQLSHKLAFSAGLRYIVWNVCRTARRWSKFGWLLCLCCVIIRLRLLLVCDILNALVILNNLLQDEGYIFWVGVHLDCSLKLSSNLWILHAHCLQLRQG